MSSVYGMLINPKLSQRVISRLLIAIGTIGVLLSPFVVGSPSSASIGLILLYPILTLSCLGGGLSLRPNDVPSDDLDANASQGYANISVGAWHRANRRVNSEERKSQVF